MLDSHFMIGQAKLGLAGDPDQVKAFADLAVSMGAEVSACVVPARAEVLGDLPVDAVKIGDLEDLESMARDAGVELIIGNSHCVQSAARLGVPVLRAGFPQFDVLGGFRKTWMGYAGTRDALFEIGNLMLTVEKGEVEPMPPCMRKRRRMRRAAMAIDRHLRVLNGSTEESTMVNGIKVAFASTDMRHVDQHFGSAKAFVMYAVDLENATMTDAVEFGALAQDGNEDKLDAKIEALQGCAAVYVQAIGGSALSKLARIGVVPQKVQPQTPIAQLVEDLQGELRAGPSAWIARALNSQRDAGRFEQMEAEGWDE